MTELPHNSKASLFATLCKPLTADVMAASGHSTTLHLPKYLVSPTSLQMPGPNAEDCLIKIMDFGEAGLGEQRRKVNCPLVIRAPETLLNATWDMRADIWSLACTVCDLKIYPSAC